ncbi:MAG: FAD-binding protein [Chlorobia bacterium]|nr:FAD-binding protein [Fimbriimonadaceae bacterium]
MVSELGRILSPEQVLSGPGAQRAYDCDAYSVDRSKPMCIVLPESTEQVAAVVRWCAANLVPFTGRGAGTGLSGGALPALGGVVVSTKRMNQIVEIDIPNRCLKAQAGIANKRLSDAVKDQGLHFAPDPSSQSVSTLGGNIAENAGGPHTLKYGVTAQHILGVTMVDPEGEILELGGKVPGGPGFDFFSLIVGSEGTVGLVTEAWVKLTPLPTAVQTALIAFPTIRDATETVAEIIASGVIPAALEMMDRGILVALEAAFGLKYPEGTAALLLVECDSNLSAEPAGELVQREIETVAAICQAHNAIDISIAQDEAERQKLWHARKKGVGAMGRLAPSIVTHDGVIPRSKLPEMLDFVYEVAERHGVKVANLFHAGDGNLHPCFYFDDRDPKQVHAVIEAGEEIIRKCVSLGGSVTGEHGVGVEKQDLLPLMFTPDDLRLQAMAKQIFNQGNLCNPCKILPTEKSCVEHKKRWRGVAW